MTPVRTLIVDDSASIMDWILSVKPAACVGFCT